MSSIFSVNEFTNRARLIHRALLWRKRGIIFVHIPKAAGSSVNEALYGRFMGHMTAREIKRCVPRTFAQLPSFSITRNPWDRLVSAYRFVRTGKGQGGRVIAAIHNPEQYETPAFRSFESFVKEWLVEQDISSIDYVFRPQTLFVADVMGNIMVSKLVKFEEIHTAENYIECCLGYPVKINHSNSSGPPTDYRNWYDSETKSIVNNLYKDDIAKFGYSF